MQGGTYKLHGGGAEGQDTRAAGLQVPRGVSTRGTRLSTYAPRRQAGERLRLRSLRPNMLSVQFGGLAALSRVNFAVERGKTHAIIGPNGAGKSTFFNCLTGVLTPTSGRIIFNGEDITGLPSNKISQKGIARSYQITNILPNASVLENVRIAAQSRRHGWNMIAHHIGLRRHQRKGGSRARLGRPARQGRRTRLQSLARRAAQSGNRHRARHRAAVACASTSRPPA